jgi:hypothetical protein
MEFTSFFSKKLGILRSAERLLETEEGLPSMELVSINIYEIYLLFYFRYVLEPSLLFQLELNLLFKIKGHL